MTSPVSTVLATGNSKLGKAERRSLVKRLAMNFAVPICLLVFPSSAYANVVWPAVMLQARMLSWWVIGVGLLVELVAVSILTKLPLKKAIIATFLMNLISAVLGTLMIPLLGVGWEFFPGSIIYPLLEVGTFNPITWTATALIATTINTAIELFSLRKISRVNYSRRLMFGLWVANLVSVSIALWSLALIPIDS